MERWRLILGTSSDPDRDVPLHGLDGELDQALEALYGNEGQDENEASSGSRRTGGLGDSAPRLNRWLGDIRQYFPTSVVQVLIKDAIERFELDRLLFEPEVLESIDADVHLVGTLLSLKRAMPEKTRDTARKVVRKVVEDLEKRLSNPLREAITGAMNRAVRNRRPRIQEIDWNRTVRRNLKHYQKEFRTVVPHELVGFGRKGQSLKDIILCVDQSGSMAASVVYASVYGAVLAGIRSVNTHMVVFDTAVVDMTKDLQDPVELLFAAQLGGGTDINKALAYCQRLVVRPADTVLVLISDLYEGGNPNEMLKRCADLRRSGVNMVVLLALSDEGVPAYDQQIAQKLAALDISAFGCTPDRFPELMASLLTNGSGKEALHRFQPRS
jgi:Mg-chelatase subunit ChlD